MELQEISTFILEQKEMNGELKEFVRQQRETNTILSQGIKENAKNNIENSLKLTKLFAILGTIQIIVLTAVGLLA